MGAIFAERVLGVAKPRVALLSIGEEKGKGDARIQRATELLDATDLRFERQRRGQGPDHATWPTSSSATRSSATSSSSSSRASRPSSSTCGGASSTGSLRGRLAYLLMRPGIGRIRGIFDYEKVGGSPLLGVRGTVIITHGRAKRRMVAFACEVAATTARTRVPELIAESLGGGGPRDRCRAAVRRAGGRT